MPSDVLESYWWLYYTRHSWMNKFNNNQTGNELFMITQQGRGSKITTFMMRLYCLASAILGGTWCFGLAGTMWTYPGIFTMEPWYQLVLGILLAASSLYGYFLANHRVVAIVLVPAAVYEVAEMIYTPYIRLNRAFGAWQFFAVVQSMYGILLLTGAVFVILHVIFVTVNRFKDHFRTVGRRTLGGLVAKSNAIFVDNMKKFKLIHLSFLCIIAGSGLLATALVNNWFIPPDASITLHPGNYHVRFQFYGDATYSHYNTSELASMSALGVRIITGIPIFITYDEYRSDPYMWWMNLTDYMQTLDYQSNRDAIINMFSPWKAGAPNVTFLCALWGIPSGFPTDYSATAGYWGVGAMLLNAWLTAGVIVEANLTNVVGFHTDQESFADGYEPINGVSNVTLGEERNFERNAQARQNYLAFFNRLRYYEKTNATWAAFVDSMNRTHGIDHILFTTTYGDMFVNDGLDNDWDMDVFGMNVVNTLPYDEFLPMLYHQSRFPPDNAHYALYFQMKKHQATLRKAGYPDRIGALLGCMGTKDSMFTPGFNGTQFVDGMQQPANGFDVIARQVMIVKAFNCTWVSFFPQNSYADQDINGFWDTFGHDFIEQLNATVNGPGSAAPFRIKFCPDVAGMNIDLARDVFLSDGWAWFYLIALISALCVVSFHQAFKRRVVAADGPSHGP
ncbi:MAG: hypothetical protein Q6353_020170 [Candidatus Sigynarchaeum springense]